MNKTTLNNQAAKRRAFTIIELLIAVIIIGILVAIIIPVLSSRANQARITAAQSDLDSISNAEQHAAIDTGYFYRLHALDDVIGGDNIGTGRQNDVIDGIRDESIHGNAQNPTLLFIDSSTGDLLTNGNTIYTRLASNETSFGWHGPYLNIAKKAGPFAPAINVPFVTYGTPLDPWGQPYLLFTKAGLIKEPEGIVVQTVNYGSFTYNTKVFDRPTLVTLGPNAAPGDGLGPGSATGSFSQSDDLMRQF